MYKKILFLIITFCFTLLIYGCGVQRTVEVSGEVKTETIEVGKCRKLLIKNIYLTNESGILPKIKIISSNERKVVVRANESLLKVKKSGEYLNITSDRNNRYITELLIIEIYGFIFEKIRLSGIDAEIDSSSLNKDLILDLSGACKANIYSFECNSLDLDVSGASSLNISSLISKEAEMTISGASSLKIDNFLVDDCEIDCSGASKLDLTGNIVNLDLEMSGASRCEAKDLIANFCDLECSGASNVKIGFSSSLRGEISGASKVIYYGPKEKVNFNVSGGSTFEEGLKK